MTMGGRKGNLLQLATPRKINMEHNNGGLEDDFPFQNRWFFGSMLIFQGVYYRTWTRFPLTPETPWPAAHLKAPLAS